MPWILAAAAATVGGALLGANAADDAASKASDAQSTASANALAAQQQNLSNITNLQTPFINAGTAALPALENHIAGGVPNFGLPTYTAAPGVQPPGTSAPAGSTAPAQGSSSVLNSTGAPITGPITASLPGAAPDPAGSPAASSGSGALIDGQPASVWDAYLQANPDVAAWAAAGHGDPSNPNGTPEQAAAYHYENGGQAEGRTITPAPTSTATQAPGTQVPVDLGTASGVVPTYARPAQGTAPTAPDASSFINPANFTTSPGYQFRLDQGLRNTNASFGAKGLLQSGAALQGFNDYAQNSASAEYQNWFNQQQQLFADANTKFQDQQGAYQFGTNNTNQNFNDDRSYGTNLALVNQQNQTAAYNTNTANLFGLAGIGTGATNALSAASTNTANNTSNLNVAAGNNQAQNALAVGNTNAQLYGTLGSTVSNLFSSPTRFGGSGTSGNIGTAQQPSYAGGY